MAIEKRNIPAHAGKTVSDRAYTVTAEEHPRTRGENNSGTVYHTNAKGTSPHTRGKPFRASTLL